MKFHQCRLCRAAAPPHVTRRLFFHNKKWCVCWTVCVGTRRVTRVKRDKVKSSVNNTDDSNRIIYLWSCNCSERIHRKLLPKIHCPVWTPDYWRLLNFETQRRSVLQLQQIMWAKPILMGRGGEQSFKGKWIHYHRIRNIGCYSYNHWLRFNFDETALLDALYNLAFW